MSHLGQGDAPDRQETAVNRSRPRDKSTRWLIGVSSFVVAATFLVSLMNFPPPTGDEGLYASAAVSLLERGTVGQTVYAVGDPWGRDTNTVTFGRSYVAGLALMLRTFGVNLLAARAFSWMGWLLASLLVYWIGSLCFDRRVALLGAFLFATSSKALFTAHLARPESWTTVGILLAVIAAIGALEAERLTVPVALFAGVMTVWPADFHGTGLAFSIGIALAVSLRLCQRRDWTGLMAYAGGTLIGLGIWLVVHLGLHGILDGVATFIGIFRPVRGGSSGDGQIRVVWLDRLTTLPQWGKAIFWTAGGPLSLMEGGLAVYGSLFAVFRGSRADRTLLVIALGALAAFGLLVPFRHLQYGILWTPFWYLLGTRAVLATGEWAASRFALSPALTRNVVSLLLGLMVLGNYLGDLWLIYQWRGADFKKTSEALADLIPEHSRVIADTTWWWALRKDRVFIADDYFVTLSNGQDPTVQRFLGVNAPPSQYQLVELTLQKLRPDYVVMDSAFRSHSDPDPSWFTLKAILQDRCSVVGSVAGPWANDVTRATTQLGQVSTVYTCSGW